MVRAWYMDDSSEDQRLEHHLKPPEFVDLSQLYDKTGVIYFQLDQDNETRLLLEEIKKERGYTFEDVVEISPEKLPNYEEKMKVFYTEHLHSDEEVRFVAAGSGYFDVRDIHDRWMRIEVRPGDLLVIPAGIYHRFTLDSNNYIKARRFFAGEPQWTPHNRPADHIDARQRYLENLSIGFRKHDNH